MDIIVKTDFLCVIVLFANHIGVDVEKYIDKSKNPSSRYVGLNWQITPYGIKTDLLLQDAANFATGTDFLQGFLEQNTYKRVTITPKKSPQPNYNPLLGSGSSTHSNIVDDVSLKLGETRNSTHAVHIKERDREIRLLQQCLLELELEYFRLVAENDAMKQQQDAEEKAFIEPWYRKRHYTERKIAEFKKSDQDNVVRMRQFQDQVAIRGFGSALDAQNNALSVAAGVAVNQRSHNDSTRFAESVCRDKKFKSPFTSDSTD